MLMPLFLIIVTAIVTSAVTIGAAWYLYQHYLKDQLDAAISDKAQIFGVMLQDHVREGVREGMDEGLTELRTGLVRKMAKSATKTGMDLFDDNMNMLFGTSRSRRKTEDEDDDDS